MEEVSQLPKAVRDDIEEKKRRQKLLARFKSDDRQTAFKRLDSLKKQLKEKRP